MKHLKKFENYIQKSENYKSLVNEFYDETELIYKTTEQIIREDIKKYLKYNYSDTYIEAALYGKYKYAYSMEDINSLIEEERRNMDLVD